MIRDRLRILRTCLSAWSARVEPSEERDELLHVGPLALRRPLGEVDRHGVQQLPRGRAQVHAVRRARPQLAVHPERLLLGHRRRRRQRRFPKQDFYHTKEVLVGVQDIVDTVTLDAVTPLGTGKCVTESNICKVHVRRLLTSLTCLLSLCHCNRYVLYIYSIQNICNTISRSVYRNSWFSKIKLLMRRTSFVHPPPQPKPFSAFSSKS